MIADEHVTGLLQEVDSKNEHEFETVAPRLDRVSRAWLAEALEIVHPGHRWLSNLDAE